MIVRITSRFALLTGLLAFAAGQPALAGEPIGAPPAIIPAAPAAPIAKDQVSHAAVAVHGQAAPLAPFSFDAPPPAPAEASPVIPAGRRTDGVIMGPAIMTPGQMTGPTMTGMPNVIYSEPIYDSSSPYPMSLNASQSATTTSPSPAADTSAQPVPSNGGHVCGTTMNGEASIRICDNPQMCNQGPNGGLRKHDLRMACPECRFCPHGLPYWQCPQCEPTCRQIHRYAHMHGVVLPPDYGFCPPGKLPIDQVSIDYYKMFPNSWYGYGATQGVVRPQVYYPTDTTQLGYTYQHVPRWLPAYGMTPPVPYPPQWNIPMCSTCGNYGCRGNCGLGGRCGLCGRGCRDGQCPSGQCPSGQCQPGGCPTGQCQNPGCPTCQNGGAIIVDEPVPADEVPPPAAMMTPTPSDLIPAEPVSDLNQSAALPGALDINAAAAPLAPMPN